jgi:hypothetical protein
LRQHISTVVAALIISSVPCPAKAQEGPSDVEALQRLVELGAMASDRSNPDRAMRSYFLFMNNREEASCLQTLLHRRHLSNSGSPLTQANTITDSARNQFFSGLAHRVLSRRYDDDFGTCMRKRNTYSYEIQGVEPIGLERTRITVLAKNTTPIPSGAYIDSLSMQTRTEGTRMRFDFSRTGNEWKIDQIEEWSRFGGGWFPQFREQELREQVPAYVPVRPY